MANQKNPHLIILDYLLLDMTGEEVCRILKASQKTKTIPVLFLTVVKDSYTMLQYYEAQAENFLIKPINTRLLLNEVNLILRESKESH